MEKRYKKWFRRGITLTLCLVLEITAWPEVLLAEEMNNGNTPDEGYDSGDSLEPNYIYYDSVKVTSPDVEDEDGLYIIDPLDNYGVLVTTENPESEDPFGYGNTEPQPEPDEPKEASFTAPSVTVVDTYSYDGHVAAVKTSGDGASATINGDAGVSSTAGAVGAMASNGSNVTVNGDLSAMGGGLFNPVPERLLDQIFVDYGNARGAFSFNADITVGGEISAASPDLAAGVDAFSMYVPQNGGQEVSEDHRANRITAGSIKVIGGSAGFGAAVLGSVDIHVDGDVTVGGYDLEHDYFEKLAKDLVNTYFSPHESFLDDQGTDEPTVNPETAMEAARERIKKREETEGSLRIGILASDMTADERLFHEVDPDLIPEYDREEYQAAVESLNDEAMRAFLNANRPKVVVGGNVKAENSRIAAGILSNGTEVTVGGTVSAEGRSASGASLIRSSLEAGEIDVTGEKSAKGITALDSDVTVNGNVQTKTVDEDAAVSAGLILSASDVHVKGDVEAGGNNSVGAVMLNIGDDLITIMKADANAQGDELFDEDGVPTLQRDVRLLEKLIGTAANGGNTLVVEGTITAENGILAADSSLASQAVLQIVKPMEEQANAKIAEMVENQIIADSSLETIKNKLDVMKAEMKQIKNDHSHTITDYWGSYTVFDNASWRNQYIELQSNVYDLEDAYIHLAAIDELTRGIANPGNPNCDITTWRINAQNEIVKSGLIELEPDKVLYPFLKPDDLGPEEHYVESGKRVDTALEGLTKGLGTLQLEVKQEFADTVQQDINYIIKIGSVTGGDGKIELSGTRSHQNFDTGKEGEEIIIKVSHSDDYEIESVSAGEFAKNAILIRNADGTYTLKVPAGGGVEISAVLKAIKKEQPVAVIPTEPEPKPEEPVEPSPVPETIPQNEETASEEPAVPNEMPAVTGYPSGEQKVEAVTVIPQIIQEEEPVIEAPARGTWALFDLIATVICTLLGIWLTFHAVRTNQKDEKDTEETKEQKACRREKLESILPAAASVIILLLTQDLTARMILVDKWFLLLAALLLCNCILFAMVWKKEHHDGQDTSKHNPGLKASLQEPQAS